MARDSSGTYSRAASISASTIASSTDMNTELNDIGSEITASLEASGKKVWTGNQNANGYGIRSLLNTKVHTTAGGTTAYTVTTGASLSSIATMAVLFIKMNATNTGASTLNVDGIGATSIVKTGSTAVASGDLVSGYVYAVLYDGTNWQLLNVATSGAFQPLDATLTALAALSYSSGNALVQFTAADTVSLTLAPSVTSVTASNSTGATTAAATFTNTTDNATVKVATFQGDRATPANSDSAYIFLGLSDSAGNQDEFARIGWGISDVTSTSEDGFLSFGVIQAGTLTTELILSGSSLNPATNDGLTLGTASLGFADLHLATGGVINWANGLVTMTHDSSRDMLDVAAGAFRARIPASSTTTGALTAADANTIVTCTGGITLDNSVFTAGDTILFDPGTSNRTFTRGSGVTMYVNGVDSATATLAANKLGSALWRSASVVILSGAFS